MKTINLLTHLMAFQEMSDFNVFKNYAIIEGQYAKKKTRKEEEDVLQSFVRELQKETDSFQDYDHYYWNYTIPHFGQEFDLLRIGDETVIDIELKSKADEEKIRRQLVKNTYYLKALDRDVLCFSYIQQGNRLYYLQGETLERCSFQELYGYISRQSHHVEEDIDDLMVPTQYLVSPFNKPLQFLDNAYFLTSHQNMIKKDIIAGITQKQGFFYGITGDAGTGKTLLTYDLAKTLRATYRVLIIHCADLNAGQMKLIERGLSIVSIKQLRHVSFDAYDIILIDEAQRLWRKQYDKIVQKAQEKQLFIIFSYDPKQTLSQNDADSDIIADYEQRCQIFKLTNTIRTNNEIMRFVTNLFDLKKRSHPSQSYPNIEVVYFNDIDQLERYLKYLNASHNWTFINFTASPYDALNDEAQSNSIYVIGQEFDDVVVYLDETFYYDDKGQLCARPTPGIHYLTEKMLYQNMTRATKKLKLIIVHNPQVFAKCVGILSRSYRYEKEHLG